MRLIFLEVGNEPVTAVKWFVTCAAKLHINHLEFILDCLAVLVVGVTKLFNNYFWVTCA